MVGNYTLENFANDSGFMVNMQLITNSVFDGLSAKAILLYGIFKHRMYSSFRNSDKFSDENGLFIYFPLKEICETFRGDNERSVKRWLKELRDFKLIETQMQGLGKPQKIYLKTVSYAISALGGTDENGNIMVGSERVLEYEDEPEDEDYEFDDIFSRTIKHDSQQTGQKSPIRGDKKYPLGDNNVPSEGTKSSSPYSILNYSNKIQNNNEEIVEKQKAQAHFCPPQPQKKTRKKKTFVEPTLEEVKQFFTENNFVLDAEDFLLKQQQRGWLLKNGQHVVDWKASARLWNRNEVKYRSEKGSSYAYRGRISERERFKPTESTDPDDWRIV